MHSVRQEHAVTAKQTHEETTGHTDVVIRPVIDGDPTEERRARGDSPSRA